MSMPERKTPERQTVSSEDHRVRVGAERREKMKARLIDCALVVFTRKGADGAVIDDVIALAGVSRGTFYNYYRTNEDLFRDVTQATANELYQLIEMVVGDASRPLDRLSVAVRLLLHTVRRYPHFGEFYRRAGTRLAGAGTLAHLYLMRDVGMAIEHDEIGIRDPELAIDLIVGCCLAGVDAMLNRHRLASSYPEELCYQMLLGLSVPPGVAEQMVALPLETIQIPPDSLIERTNHIHREAQNLRGRST